MISNITLQVSFITTQVQKNNIQPKIQKRSRNGWRSREPKGRVEHDRTRAGQPAHKDKPGPPWKAPLRPKPQNLNMQIQRVKTYNNK